MRSLINRIKMFFLDLYNYDMMLKALKKDIEDTMLIK